MMTVLEKPSFWYPRNRKLHWNHNEKIYNYCSTKEKKKKEGEEERIKEKEN